MRTIAANAANKVEPRIPHSVLTRHLFAGVQSRVENPLIAAEFELATMDASGNAVKFDEITPYFEVLGLKKAPDTKYDHTWLLPGVGRMIPEASHYIGEMNIEPTTSLLVLKDRYERLADICAEAAEMADAHFVGTGRHYVQELSIRNWIQRNPRLAALIRKFATVSAFHEATVSCAGHVHINAGTDNNELFRLIDVLLDCSGFVICAFANSQVYDGLPNFEGPASIRATFWDRFTGEDRVGLPKERFRTAEKYARYLYGATYFMAPIVEGDELYDKSLLHYIMESGTAEDGLAEHLDNHHNSVWPEARFNRKSRAAEARSADSVQRSAAMDYAGFVAGTLANLERMEREITAPFSRDFWSRVRYAAADKGLEAEVDGQSVRELALHAVLIAQEGLELRRQGEERLMDNMVAWVQGVKKAPQEINREIFATGGGIPDLVARYSLAA